MLLRKEKIQKIVVLFFEELGKIPSNSPKYDLKIVVEDFNANKVEPMDLS